MPFTYSITNGIGAGFVACVVIKTALFLVYFAIDLIEQLLGVK